MSNDHLSIYETSDLPEADQVEIETNYKKEYETEPVVELTPRENYDQLKVEISDLIQQLERLNKNKKDPEDMGRIYEEVERFKKDMEAIGQDLELVEKINLTDPQSLNFKKMMSDIDKFKFPEKPADPTVMATSDLIEGPPDLVLKTKPNIVRPDNNSKLSELEVRLLKLEEIVGYEKNKEFSKISGLLNQSIVQTMSNLELLNIENIGDVESKCGGVLRRLDQLSSSLEHMEEKEKMDKISDLYDFMLKLKPLESNLPKLVDRLESLKQLHQHALSFNTLLKQLELTQTKIMEGLKDNKQLVKKVQDQMNLNLEIIKSKYSELGTN